MDYKLGSDWTQSCFSFKLDTGEERGKRVGINGFKSKRMITGVVCYKSMSSPPRIPKGLECHTTKHLSNEDTMLCISDVIIPYVNCVRHSVGVR